ncbi:Zn-dependent hydrolase [bacterium]|nr:MAG: Zn-dependent hydrolase [bacterium]
MKNWLIAGMALGMLVACKDKDMDKIQTKRAMYAEFTLTADVSTLSENEKKMVPLMIEAAKIMDEVFWMEAYGDKADFDKIDIPVLKELVKINYGPWDRLNNNEPFVAGYGAKPKGANYYPKDMTKEEFEAWDNPDKKNLYTVVKRDEAGNLYTQFYHEVFKEKHEKAADLLRQAAELAEDEGLKTYLTLRAEALLTDDYQASDFAWMDMKNNGLDLVIGPIETYEDQLFGYKASHEAYVLIKDKMWSDRLAKYAAMLPDLQKGLPVQQKYKNEMPGTDSDLNAYDVVYYAGDCNSGSKTIAINLPNDEEVQLTKGTRRLQLKNAMKAKFDKIMLPIADVLIDETQRRYITFDAFFNNTMFHEVAHGLGIKNTINGKGTVREAMKEQASALEEGKADILGLYMVSKLIEAGEVKGSIEEHYTTFMAGIFRSVRFGAASAHGRANMLRFNYFQEKGAFYKTENNVFKVDFVKMREAMDSLSELILSIQGDGDYAKVSELMKTHGVIKPELQHELDRLAKANIPVDIVFNQGAEVLGL